MNYLVFGATGGVGSSLCRSLSEDHQIFLSSKTEANLEELSQKLKAKFFVCDVTDEEQVKKVFQEIKDLDIQLDGVIHCVGSILLKPIHITKTEEWDEVMNLNLKSAFFVLKASALHMLKTGGSLVFVSSVAAGVGLQNHGAIAAAKAGLEGMVRASAATYARYGIRINAVSPSLTETAMSTSLLQSEAMKKASAERHPLKRIGQPKDIASAISFFLSAENDWVTGQVLRVDGGLSTLRVF
jgi:NAD(P)-dependent dehydrogenase (short-subunit alcohol dehydrogenase family)